MSDLVAGFETSTRVFDGISGFENSSVLHLLSVFETIRV